MHTEKNYTDTEIHNLKTLADALDREGNVDCPEGQKRLLVRPNEVGLGLELLASVDWCQKHVRFTVNIRTGDNYVVDDGIHDSWQWELWMDSNSGPDQFVCGSETSMDGAATMIAQVIRQGRTDNVAGMAPL